MHLKAKGNLIKSMDQKHASSVMGVFYMDLMKAMSHWSMTCKNYSDGSLTSQ